MNKFDAYRPPKHESSKREKAEEIALAKFLREFKREFEVWPHAVSVIADNSWTMEFEIIPYSEEEVNDRAEHPEAYPRAERTYFFERANYSELDGDQLRDQIDSLLGVVVSQIPEGGRFTKKNGTSVFVRINTYSRSRFIDPEISKSIIVGVDIGTGSMDLFDPDRLVMPIFER